MLTCTRVLARTATKATNNRVRVMWLVQFTPFGAVAAGLYSINGKSVFVQRVLGPIGD